MDPSESFMDTQARTANFGGQLFMNSYAGVAYKLKIVNVVSF